MRWIVNEIYQGVDNVYSGWIWWNLFLAFIPLLLSFRLFRRKAISPMWFTLACFGTALIGVIGLKSRLPRLIRVTSLTLSNLQARDPGTLMHLLWIGIVIVVSLGISLWLFKRPHRSKDWLGWWLGLAFFIAFLPNAPYVLTDIIHLIRGTSAGTSRVWVIALVFIPTHLVAIVLGFEAYVISLLNINFYLKQKGLQTLTLLSELGIHALCAIGIYFGRFIRLNSWDVVLDPTSVLATTLNTLTSKRPLAVITITFIILTLFYWVMKQITLGLKLRVHYAQAGLDALD